MPKSTRTRAFSLPGPMVVDQCRLDTMVIGPLGEAIRPCLAVIITPRDRVEPFFSCQLPPEVDAHFRGIADALRDVLGAAEAPTAAIDGDFKDHELRDDQ